MSTTYTKLRDGSWGVRGTGLVAGARTSVIKRDGSSKTETVGRVLWTGPDGVSIATVEQQAKDSGAASTRSRSSRSGGRCRSCGGPIVDAAHQQAMGGYCGSCAFDEM